MQRRRGSLKFAKDDRKHPAQFVFESKGNQPRIFARLCVPLHLCVENTPLEV